MSDWSDDDALRMIEDMAISKFVSKTEASHSRAKRQSQ